jgi:hypothetical protein
MTTRKVTYASTANMSGASTHYSAAESWGELKNESPDIEAKSMGMKAWLKGEGPNKGTAITSDTQRLPEGDIVIYFLVDKNDSGR